MTWNPVVTADISGIQPGTGGWEGHPPTPAREAPAWSARHGIPSVGTAPPLLARNTCILRSARMDAFPIHKRRLLKTCLVSLAPSSALSHASVPCRSSVSRCPPIHPFFPPSPLPPQWRGHRRTMPRRLHRAAQRRGDTQFENPGERLRSSQRNCRSRCGSHTLGTRVRCPAGYGAR